MQPNNPYEQPGHQLPQPQPVAPQPQPLSADYLNSIATQPTVKTMNPMILWGMIGGLLLLAVIVIFSVTSALGGNTTGSLTSVAAKLDRLNTVSNGARKNIQNSDLRTLNSSLGLSLTNTNRDLQVPLKAEKINLKDKKNSTVKLVNEDFAKLDTRLEDARLNAVYDRTYAREMTYTIKTLQSDMAVLYKKSKSKQLRETLLTADENLTPIVEGFSQFNAS